MYPGLQQGIYIGMHGRPADFMSVACWQHSDAVGSAAACKQHNGAVDTAAAWSLQDGHSDPGMWLMLCNISC